MFFYGISQVGFILLFSCNYGLIHIFDFFYFGSYPMIDLVNRLTLGDTIINWYSFYWTSNIYLSLVFFCYTLLMILLIRKFVLSSLLFLVIGAGGLWLIENINFLLLNVSPAVLDLTSSDVNSLLTNNLNKYHPAILYYSAFLALVGGFTLVSKLFNPYSFSSTLGLNEIYRWSQNLFVISFIALALGSWWALQEGTWGGWWNWDASEVLGLLILILGYLEIHTYSHFYVIDRKIERVVCFLVFIAISYYFIQLNFELTSHSFGTRFNYFFNNHLFFLQTITTLILLLYLYIKSITYIRVSVFNFWVWSKVEVTLINFIRSLLFSYVVILTLLLVFSSFSPLVNYFLWQFIKVNSFNYPTSISTIVLVLTLIVLIIFYTSSYSFLPQKWVLPIISPIEYLWTTSLLLVTKLSGLYWLHFAMLLFTIVNIWSLPLQLAYMWVGFYPYYYFDSYELQQPNYQWYSCHNFFIDNSINYTTNFNFKTSQYNFFYKTNSPKLNEFYLLVNAETCVSLFFTGNTSFKSVIFLELITLPTLLEALIFFTVLLQISLVNSIQSYKTLL